MSIFLIHGIRSFVSGAIQWDSCGCHGHFLRPLKSFSSDTFFAKKVKGQGGHERRWNGLGIRTWNYICSIARARSGCEYQVDIGRENDVHSNTDLLILCTVRRSNMVWVLRDVKRLWGTRLRAMAPSPNVFSRWHLCPMWKHLSDLSIATMRNLRISAFSDITMQVKDCLQLTVWRPREGSLYEPLCKALWTHDVTWLV